MNRKGRPLEKMTLRFANKDILSTLKNSSNQIPTFKETSKFYFLEKVIKDKSK